MEYALTADHHRVHALDAEKGQEYYCPVCGNQVIPRQGEVNSWHFAHVTSCVDDWKYDMSEWHRNWQNRFPESTREVVIEYKGESHRADILTGGYVIEFQHSPITSTEFERRNLFYIYISIDNVQGSIGDTGCCVVNCGEELFDKLVWELAVDIMEEVGHTIDPTEATLLERREIERRIHPYLEQLPTYQDRLQRVFTREKD